MISLDTETTGIDLFHGARPFFVTTSFPDSSQKYWEWDVNPLTRQPIIPPKDIDEVMETIDYSFNGEANSIVMQNSRFDVRALKTIVTEGGGLSWDWERTHDTLIAGHLLASNHAHDLTSMVLEYVGVDISKYEDDLNAACNQARRDTRKFFPKWKIAGKDLVAEMPSVKDKTWKFDTWLPRAFAKKLRYAEPDPNCEHQWDENSICGLCEGHRWWIILSEYANVDSEATLLLWARMEDQLKRRDLWEIYLERMKVLPVADKIERRGVTVSLPRSAELQAKYNEELEESSDICKGIADSFGYDLKLPKGGTNKLLTEFCFRVLKLPVIAYTDGGSPSLNGAVLDQYSVMFDSNTKESLFCKNLRAIRKRSTALTYLSGYNKFMQPYYDTEDKMLAALFPLSPEFLSAVDGGLYEHWQVLHPSINPTGTDTLRWSSSNPNEQNISKQEGFNLRYVFGPAPGREWYSLDANNIELRLPAYEAGEEEMIALFERPNDPPYYGSNHLLVSHILHPEKFEACVNEKGEVDGRIFKKKYASTLYQWVKNGNFAVQYGAIESSGTADAAYHVRGGQRKVQSRFRKIASLNQLMIKQARKLGYVETIPDKTVNPNRGYPLICSRSMRGDIIPTVPLNYHVQGTACWWMMKAMIRCQNLLDEWRDNYNLDAYIVMQVHDELVFDFPKSKRSPVIVRDEERRAVESPRGEYTGGKPNLFRTLLDRDSSNYWFVKQLQKEMAKGGDDIGIPTPVGIEYHEDNWSEGVTL